MLRSIRKEFGESVESVLKYVNKYVQYINTPYREE